MGAVAFSVQKSGQGIVTGAGISCGTDCTQSYTLGEDCEYVGSGGNHNAGRVECTTVWPDLPPLSAAGTNGFEFAGWSGVCSGKGICYPNWSGPVIATFVDSVDPVVHFNDGRAELGGPAFAVTAAPTDNDKVTRVEFRIGEQTPFATVTNPPYTAVVDSRTLPNRNPVKITARAVDASDRAAEESHTYVVDNSVSLGFTALPDRYTNEAAPKVSFNSNDDDILGYTCTTLRAGAVLPGPPGCSSPYSPPATVDGDYVVSIAASDDAGNTRTESYAFSVDRAKPVVAIATPARGGLFSTGFVPVYTVTDANLKASQDACSLDGGPFGPCGPVAVPAPDGTHTLRVRAVDQAGNVAEASAEYVTDTTGPQLAFTGGPAENEILATADANFAFAAQDPHGPVVAQCKLDDAPYGPCTGADLDALAGLTEGGHVVTVRARDGLGNVRDTARRFTVNAVRPTVTITSGLPDGAPTTADFVSFGFAATGGTVECALDGGAYRPCAAGDYDVLGGIADGPHTFRVRVRDEANDESVATRSFVVDRAPPETTIDAGPGEGEIVTASAATFAFHSAPGSSFRCRFGPPGGRGAFRACGGPGSTHSVSGLAPGAYVFEVYAVNALGLSDLTPARRAFTLTRALDMRMASQWEIARGRTTVLELTVKGVPVGGEVRVSCRGRSCGFKTKRVAVKDGVAKLKQLFRRRALTTGATVEISVTAPGAIAHMTRFTMRTGKYPKRRDFCVPPGTSRRQSC
jgi:hypothetical protein